MSNETALNKANFDRNNTNISRQIYERIKKIKPEDKFKFLTYYQNITRDYVLNVDVGAKGILIAYTMGMGKSMIAVAIAIDAMMAGYDPIILTTKSLHENMRKSIIKYVKLRAAADQHFAIGKLSDKDLDAWINRNFSFVSLNASNMMKQMSNAARSFEEKEIAKGTEMLPLDNLNGKLLIVDEAHNFFRAITNGSKNAIGLYDIVMSSKNVKIVFLTGTPVSSDPFELVPCFNMIARRDGKSILPPDWKTFNTLYVDQETGHIKNKEFFQNRIFGLVSYVDHKSIKKVAENAVEFPEELKTKIVLVNMSKHQYILYQLARDKEREENKVKARLSGIISHIPLLQKPKGEVSGSYRVRSRQLSNYAPPSEFTDYILGNSKYKKTRKLAPEESGVITEPQNVDVLDLVNVIKDKDVSSPKLEAMFKNITAHKNTLGIVYSQFVGIGGLGILKRFLLKHGYKLYSGQSKDKLETVNNDWITVKETEKTGGQEAPKKVQMYPSLFKKEKEFDKNSLVVEKWKKYIKDIRKSAQISIKKTHPTYVERTYSYKPKTMKPVEISGGAASPNTFAIIYGGISPEERDNIQTVFNSKDNIHGEKICLILLSSTGAEGLDLHNVRHVHIMEPYWNYSRIDQVKHRAIRNNSHIDLPEKERNVSIYIYLSIKPEDTKDAVLSKIRIIPKKDSKDVSAAVDVNILTDSGDKPATGEITSGPDVQLRDKRDKKLPADVISESLTTEVKLFRDSLKNQVSIQSFTAALQEVSIECEYNAELTGSKRRCRSCLPNNQTLFSNNPDVDVKGTDRCSRGEEKTVKVKEVIIDGATYYYSDDMESVFGYNLYEYDASIDGYRQLSYDNPLYNAVNEKKN